MASIYKPKGSRKYRIAFKDHNGKRKTTWGYRDKQATQARAKKLETDSERRQAGLRTTEKKRIDHAQESYLVNLINRNTAVSHIKETTRILSKIILQCGWTFTTDANNAAFTRYLEDMPGAAPRTRNRHQETLRAFLNFCCRMDWLEENPIARLPMTPVGQAGRRHRRRAFTVEEFQKLIAATPEPRKTIYTIAAFSGLRRSELARITDNDFNSIDGIWLLRANVTKNRKQEHLPMVPECRQTLRRHPAQPNGKCFKSIPHVWTLRADMKRAGIERVAPDGRVLDFHSFRYFFCTLLAKHLPIQQVRRLMRHQDIRLTMNLYDDLGLAELTENVQAIPRLLPEAP